MRTRRSKRDELAERERQRRLEEIRRQVERGELVVRQATAAELEEWAVRREQLRQAPESDRAGGQEGEP